MILLYSHPADEGLPECLMSFHVPEADVRKGEISDPVPGSNSWVWDHPALQNLRDSRSGALAIIGKAGSGKSVIGKTILQGLRTQWTQPLESPSSMLVGEWFYCQRRGETFTTYISLLRFVLFKFLVSDGSLFNYCKSKYRRDPPTRTRFWAEEELEEVLEHIMKDSFSITMVFDAIDESGNDRMVQFIEALSGDPRSRTKTIFLSRPRQEFEGAFWKRRRIVLQNENGGDIQIVASHGLIKLQNIMYGNKSERDDGPLVRSHAALRQARSVRHAPSQNFTRTRPDVGSSLDVVRKTIIERAEGVVLWVVLVFDNLYKFAKDMKIPPRVDKLLSIVGQLPHELDDFYGQMVRELIKNMSDEELGVAQSTLKWVTIANQYKRFTLGELWDALAIDDWSKTPTRPITDFRMGIQSWSHFGNIILLLCGPFMEILPSNDIRFGFEHGEETRTEQYCWPATPRQFKIWTPKDDNDDGISEDSAIQLIHQTVKDFLASSQQASHFSITRDEASSTILASSTTFVKLVLPENLESAILVSPGEMHPWLSFTAEVAVYLDEFRLFTLCCQLANTDPSSLSELKPQTNMLRSSFLPVLLQNDHNYGDWWLFGNVPSKGLKPWMVRLIFHFATETGLRYGAPNLLSAINLGRELDFEDFSSDAIKGMLFNIWDTYRDGGFLRLKWDGQLNPKTYSTELAVSLDVCDITIHPLYGQELRWSLDDWEIPWQATYYISLVGEYAKDTAPLEDKLITIDAVARLLTDTVEATR